MAAPHIGAAATLLLDSAVSDPRAVKAILINTADFVQGQSGWDRAYGWGYVNLRPHTPRIRLLLDTLARWSTSTTGVQSPPRNRVRQVPNA